MYTYNNSYTAHFPSSLSPAVPQPEVTAVLSADGTVSITDPDSFSVSLLVEVDPGVDVPLPILAVWSGHPSLSDTPRVTPVTSPLTGPPYTASLVFSSIKPRDLGQYTVSVTISDDSREGVVGSSPLDVDITLSLGIH